MGRERGRLDKKGRKFYSFFFSLEGEGEREEGRELSLSPIPLPVPAPPHPLLLRRLIFFVGFSAVILFSEPAVFAGPERMDVLKIITWAVEEPVSGFYFSY